MSASTSPIFTLTPASIPVATSGSADTSLTSPTHTTTLLTGGANGSLFCGAYCKATVTTAAGMVRFYHNHSGTRWLIGEVPTQAITPGANTAAADAIFRPVLGDIPVANGDTIEVTTEKAEVWHVYPLAGHF
jgi:hypothetical protein